MVKHARDGSSHASVLCAKDTQRGKTSSEESLIKGGSSSREFLTIRQNHRRDFKLKLQTFHVLFVCRYSGVIVKLSYNDETRSEPYSMQYEWMTFVHLSI